MSIYKKKKSLVLCFIVLFLFISLPCLADYPDELPYDNDLTIITGIEVEYDTNGSSTGAYTTIFYHVPFIFWVIVAVISLWIATRLVLEFVIRFRNG